jgi:predicted Fe-Mo cluster-binding NifX family protein
MTDTIKVALPILDGRVSPHFGHPDSFLFLEVDPAGKQILDREHREPPPHEQGVLPAWLADEGVGVVLAGGIGPRAIALLEASGIDLRSGVPDLEPEEAVRLWMDGALEAGANMCDREARPHRHRCKH